LEDTVDLEAYRSAVHAEAVAANGSELMEMPIGEFHEPRTTAVKTWFEQAGLVAPSKIAVANRLVQDGRAVPSEQGRQVLQELHNQVMSIFGI
jgi:hypothetical protein